MPRPRPFLFVLALAPAVATRTHPSTRAHLPRLGVRKPLGLPFTER